MTNYSRGRAFEYRVKDRLEALGWFCIRSAGSHSEIDLLACKGTRMLGIQCKGGKSAFGIEGWDGLFGRCYQHRWIPIVALKGMVFMQLTGPYDKIKDWIQVDIT